MVSLIIRTKNEAAYIGRTLDAVFSQTCRPSEIIVIDSGSTDGTIEIVSDYDIKFISIPPDRFTYGYALNAAAQEARGEYLISLSAHALPANPLWLERLLEPLADPAVAGTSSHQVPYPGGRLEPYLIFWQALYRWHLQMPVVQRYLFSNACSAIRAHLWRTTPFNEMVASCEDHLWAMQMQGRGHRITYAFHSIVFHSHDVPQWVMARRHWRELRALVGLYFAYLHRRG
jgi:rhamnosyltransferase